VEVVVMAIRRVSFPVFIRGKLRINGQLLEFPKKQGQKIWEPEVPGHAQASQVTGKQWHAWHC
jgi:hypothetical protein